MDMTMEENKDEIKFMGIETLSTIQRIITRFMSSGLILGTNDPTETIDKISHTIIMHKLEVKEFIDKEEKE